MTTEEEQKLPFTNINGNNEPHESIYADDVEFWRTHQNFFHLLIDIQLSIINLQMWCYKWRISINISKTNYMVFYNKKNKPPPPSIPVTIDEIPLEKVHSKRILGIEIDEDLSFTKHIENITIKCKKASNRLTIFPELNPHLAVLLYKSYVRSKLEYGSAVWGYTINKKNHLSMLESAQKGALSLILRTLKSTPSDALESELYIPPIDLRLQELQRHEAIKLLQKEDSYFSNKMKSQNSSNSPFAHLSRLSKQLLSRLAASMGAKGPENIILPAELPPSIEIFNIPNMTTVLPKTPLSETNNKEKNFAEYIDLIYENVNENTMLAYADGSAQGNPGPTGAGLLIRKNGRNSIPVLSAKAITSRGTSYEGELEAILMTTQHALKNLRNENDALNIYTDCQAALLAITSHTQEHYHNQTIDQIRVNLIEISLKVNQIKLIYCPGHKGIPENEIADSLAKTGSRKAKHLPLKVTVTPTEIKKNNHTLTIEKWAWRWENSKSSQYKELIPKLTIENLKQRALHLRFYEVILRTKLSSYKI